MKVMYTVFLVIFEFFKHLVTYNYSKMRLEKKKTNILNIIKLFERFKQ